jgi:hypothetical protein
MTLTMAFRVAPAVLLLVALTVSFDPQIARGNPQTAATDVSKSAWKVEKTPLRNNKNRWQDNYKYNGAPEKIIEDQIPAHLPIAVELRNLDKEPFFDSFEVRITNLGQKPIYHLYFVLIVPQAAEQGFDLGIRLEYGRAKLIEGEEPLQASDVPINPGETKTVGIEPKYVKGLVARCKQIGVDVGDLRRLVLVFQSLNCGDGTGFWSTEGSPWKSKRLQSTSSAESPGGSLSLPAELDVATE